MKFKKLRKHYKWAAVLLLLPLCVMACGGADAETAPPKSPYELENMITANDADIASILADISVLHSEIAAVETTDYSSQIADILARLTAIEARLNPTPTPTATGSGGEPVPTTPPASGQGITGNLVEDEVREDGTYNFDVGITAGSATLSKYVILELVPTTTDKPDISGTPTLTWTGTPNFDCTMSPSGTNCELVRLVSDAKVTVPAGATHTFSAQYSFAYSGGTPVGWVYSWYLSDTQ